MGATKEERELMEWEVLFRIGGQGKGGHMRKKKNYSKYL